MLRVDDAQSPGDTGDLENATRWTGRGDDGQLAFCLADATNARDDGSEPGGVHEGYVFEVHSDVAVTFAHRCFECLVELRRSCDVDFSVCSHDDPSPIVARAINAQFHWHAPSRGARLQVTEGKRAGGPPAERLSLIVARSVASGCPASGPGVLLLILGRGEGFDLAVIHGVLLRPSHQHPQRHDGPDGDGDDNDLLRA